MTIDPSLYVWTTCQECQHPISLGLATEVESGDCMTIECPNDDCSWSARISVAYPPPISAT